MLILGIDTATPWGTAALVDDGKLIFEFVLQAGKGGGEHLLALMQQFLPKTGRDLRELDLIAVGTGPGSYTGIRIGLATAAGLAEGLQIPVYGISTLRIIAENARYGTEESSHVVAVATDARRAEVYAALYQADGDNWRELMPPQTLPAVQFATKIGEYPKVILCGDGGKNYRSAYEALPGLRLAPERWDYPRARLAAEIAWRDWTGERRMADHNVTPDYLRKVEAEIRLEEKLRDVENSANVCEGFGRNN